MKSAPIRPSALIVENELVVALALALAIEETGVEVLGIFTLGEDAVRKVEELRPDVVIMDVRLAGRMDGIEAARIIRRSWQGPILFHSAESDAAACEVMATLGVLAPKPAPPRKVAAIVLELAMVHVSEPTMRPPLDTAGQQSLD